MSFVVNKVTRHNGEATTGAMHTRPSTEQRMALSTARQRGRPRHERVDYDQTHPRFKEKHRIVRREGHHTLPNFIGRYFPARDHPNPSSFYCTSMLMLLKPWRSLATDLKESSDTWQSAFNSFVVHAPPEVQRILSGIQYFHHCQESVQMGMTSSHAVDNAGDAEHCMEDVPSEERSTGIASLNMPMLTEELVSEVLAAQTPYGEQIHAIHALEAARYAGIFEDKSPSERTPLTVTADDMHRAAADDIQNLLVWKEQMQGNVYEQNTLSTPGDHTHSRGTHSLPTVDVIDEEQIRGGGYRAKWNRTSPTSSSPLHRPLC